MTARDAKTVGAAAKESMADGVRFLTKRGFHEVKRDWESRLFVKGFDFERFGTADERVAKQGIRIVTLAEEMERDPAALQKTYELNEDCRMDVRAWTADPDTFESSAATTSTLQRPPDASTSRLTGRPVPRRLQHVPFTRRPDVICRGSQVRRERAARASRWR